VATVGQILALQAGWSRRPAVGARRQTGRRQL